MSKDCWKRNWRMPKENSSERRLLPQLITLMDWCGQRLGEVCNPSFSEILFHLANFNRERFVTENVANPAGEITALRMGFQGCSR